MKRTFLIIGCLAGLLAISRPSHAQPGALDTNFNALLNAGAQVYAVAVQTNGQIIIGGSFASTLGIAPSNLARLNTNGTPDAGFDIDLSINNAVNVMRVLDNGQI